MHTMLEVEPEVASKIQARARERGVSVDVYLRELIDQKGTESENSNALSSQERIRLLREWASGHSANMPLLSDDAINRESIYSARN
jgi:hypothetical protein